MSHQKNEACGIKKNPSFLLTQWAIHSSLTVMLSGQKSHLSCICSFQKHFIKMITVFHRFSSPAPLFPSFRIPPIFDLNCNCLLIFQPVNILPPLSFSTVYFSIIPKSIITIQGQPIICIQLFFSTFSQFSIRFWRLHCWNYLSSHIRTSLKPFRP